MPVVVVVVVVGRVVSAVFWKGFFGTSTEKHLDHVIPTFEIHLGHINF